MLSDRDRRLLAELEDDLRLQAPGLERRLRRPRSLRPPRTGGAHGASSGWVLWSVGLVGSGSLLTGLLDDGALVTATGALLVVLAAVGLTGTTP